MKIASASAAGGREATRERQRRGRIAAPSMRLRYPTLGSLKLDFDFSDTKDFVPSPQVTVFHPPAPAYFSFGCPYSDCSGEFNLASAVDLAVSSGDTQSQGQISCAGTRHGGAQCTLCLEYSISPHWL